MNLLSLKDHIAHLKLCYMGSVEKKKRKQFITIDSLDSVVFLSANILQFARSVFVILAKFQYFFQYLSRFVMIFIR